MTPQEILAKVPPIRTPGSIAGLRDMMQHIPDGAKIVEIGCYAGESTEVLAAKAKDLFAVDKWDPVLFPYCPPGVTIEDVERAFRVRMAPWAAVLNMRGGSLVVVREASTDAPGKFFTGNPSAEDMALWGRAFGFDLGYIDADHFYSSVCADIRAWVPLIKDGGFIGGHDYNDQRWRPEVNRAVDELLGGPDLTFKDCSWLKRVTPEVRERLAAIRP